MVKNTADPLGTLSVGNVVTMSTTLYKSNFKRYLLVSLRSTGWTFLSILSYFGFAFLGGILYGLTRSWLVAIPVVVGWFILVLYLSAKSCTDHAIICRLAYQELIDTPETIAVATKHLKPRTWRFLRLHWLIGLYMFLISLGSGIVLGIANNVVSYLMFSTMNTFAIIIGGLLILGFDICWFLLLIRFYASWFIAELPLAIEQNMSANYSISRSSQLSKVAIRRLVLTILVAFLITMPLALPGQGLLVFGSLMSSPRFGGSVNNEATGGAVILLGFLLLLVIGLFSMPFWQTIKAVVYFDLRNRREGSDLSI
jgi:MFS family permease